MYFSALLLRPAEILQLSDTTLGTSIVTTFNQEFIAQHIFAQKLRKQLIFHCLVMPSEALLPTG